ncbi:hypothetical protein [Bradyrhizobium sp. USDA 4486]
MPSSQAIGSADADVTWQVAATSSIAQKFLRAIGIGSLPSLIVLCWQPGAAKSMIGIVRGRDSRVGAASRTATSVADSCAARRSRKEARETTRRRARNRPSNTGHAEMRGSRADQASQEAAVAEAVGCSDS